MVNGAGALVKIDGLTTSVKYQDTLPQTGLPLSTR